MNVPNFNVDSEEEGAEASAFADRHVAPGWHYIHSVNRQLNGSKRPQENYQHGSSPYKRIKFVQCVQKDLPAAADESAALSGSTSMNSRASDVDN